MTLATLIQQIEAIVTASPYFHEIVRHDVYKIEAEAETRYGVFAYVVSSIRISDNIATVSFTFHALDRLTNSSDNITAVVSESTSAMYDVINKLKEIGFDVSNATLTPFMQTFKDICAGVTCTCEIVVQLDTICGDVNENKTIKII